MNRILAAIVGALLFCYSLGISARSQEIISFENAPSEVSAFRKKRAEAKGETIIPPKGLVFSGVLHMPDDVGPHPAIVLVHGCMPESKWTNAWTARLIEWGYAVLAFNAFTPRGIGTICSNPSQLHGHQRSRDIEGAVQFLKNRKDILSDQIGALAMTHGSWSLLYALTPKGDKPQSIHAAVALYPLCGKYSGFTAPTWVLLGELHDPSSASRCAEYIPSVPNPHGTTLRTYLGGTHLIESYWADDENENNLAIPKSEQDQTFTEEIRQFFASHLQ